MIVNTNIFNCYTTLKKILKLNIYKYISYLKYVNIKKTREILI